MSREHHQTAAASPFSLARLGIAARLAVAGGLAALAWFAILPLVR